MSDPFPNIFSTSWLSRWWRRNITRDSLIEFLKSMRLVVPLTILIWYFAANEQLDVEKGQLIPIALKSADPNRLVRMGSMGDETVVADWSGPHAKLEYVKAELSKNPLAISVPATLPPGPYPLLTASFIKDA